MKFIIGLGNPGKKYELTRHNIGWLVLDELAKNLEWAENKQGEYLYAQDTAFDQDIQYIKPLTFMNNSGKTISYILKKHQHATIQDFVIIHDDVDIAFGKIKISHNSSSAGHNGVKSVMQALGSQDVLRIRIGVGKSDTIPTDAFVLQSFTPDEQQALPELITASKESLTTLLTTHS